MKVENVQKSTLNFFELCLEDCLELALEEALTEGKDNVVPEVNYEHKINIFPSCCGLNGELWKSDDKQMSIQNADGTLVEIYEDGKDDKDDNDDKDDKDNKGNRNIKVLSELTSDCQNIIGNLEQPLNGIGFSSTKCMCDVYAKSYGRFEQQLPTWNAKILKTAKNNYENYKVHLISYDS